jgi:hypothetical protein
VFVTTDSITERHSEEVASALSELLAEPISETA